MIFQRIGFLAWVPLCLVSFLFGCAQLTPVSQSEVCQSAVAHLSACGATMPSVNGMECDPAVAQELMALPCDQLSQLSALGGLDVSAGYIPKSRQGGTNGFLCWLGFNFACPEPACVPNPDVPAPSADDPCYAYLQYEDCGLCEYYRCRERRSLCGSDAYLEGFVGRYCDRFATVTEPRVSQRAVRWLKDVRQCLVTELEWDTNDQSTCQEIERVGIDSHATCYVENGFCELGIGDWFAIVHTIDPFDVPFRQVIVTGNSCLRTWFGLGS